MLRLLSMRLSSAGYQVTAVTSAETALKAEEALRATRRAEEDAQQQLAAGVAGGLRSD